jgi:hypothetical protein
MVWDWSRFELRVGFQHLVFDHSLCACEMIRSSCISQLERSLPFVLPHFSTVRCNIILEK